MKNVNVLIQLATLEKSGFDKFDFSHYKIESPDCTTLGCLAGELPGIVPNSWMFAGDGFTRIALVDNPNLIPPIALANYFDLTNREVEHLFVPEEQYPEEYGGEFLYEDATLEAVQNNLIEFLKLRGKWKSEINLQEI